MAKKDNEVGEILDALPDWVTVLIQLNSLIADRMGVVPSDFHCLHVLQKNGPTTSSVLATRVGLTPGSVSRMVDRLEAAGLVVRIADPTDRRKALIEPTADGLQRIDDYYAGLTARTRSDLSTFSSDDLRAIRAFVDAARASTVAELESLRSATSPSVRDTSRG